MEIGKAIDNIIRAISNNNLNKVKKIMEYNLDKTNKNILLHMAVLYSAINERTDILLYILKNSKDINEVTIRDALVQACVSNAEQSVKILIKNGKCVNLASIISECMTFGEIEQESFSSSVAFSKFEAIYFKPVDEIMLNSVKIVKMLLDNGINTSTLNKNGKSALQCAINTGNDDLIKPIIEHHAYPRYSNRALIGYSLKDLSIAQNDLEYLLNSKWFAQIMEKKGSIKEDIKALLNYKNEQELKDIVIRLAQKRCMLNIEEKLSNKESILEISTDLIKELKQGLKEVNDILCIIEKFKARVEVKITNGVLEVIDMCKKCDIKNLKKELNRIM